jgi:hypothetical protein
MANNHGLQLQVSGGCHNSITKASNQFWFLHPFTWPLRPPNIFCSLQVTTLFEALSIAA